MTGRVAIAILLLTIVTAAVFAGCGNGGGKSGSRNAAVGYAGRRNGYCTV